MRTIFGALCGSIRIEINFVQFENNSGQFGISSVQFEINSVHLDCGLKPKSVWQHCNNTGAHLESLAEQQTKLASSACITLLLFFKLRNFSSLTQVFSCLENAYTNAENSFKRWVPLFFQKMFNFSPVKKNF